jgi:GNAT superfamily N-acetyltransferase
MGEVATLEYDSKAFERVEQQFREDMWNSVTPDAVRESGVELRRFGPVQVTAFADLPEAECLNQILGAAEPEAIERGHLARAIEWMRSREVDYRVPVAQGRPGTATAEDWLGRRGYEQGGGWVKLVRDTAPLDWVEDDSVEIFELGEDEADGEGLSDIISEAFELPLTAGALFFSLPQATNWRCYTAALGPSDGIVATASMMISGGIARLGLAGTRPGSWGQGCHRALLRRRLIDAAAAGCRTVFAELGDFDGSRMEGARQNLLRAGFHEAYGSRNWQRPALHPAARVY